MIVESMLASMLVRRVESMLAASMLSNAAALTAALGVLVWRHFKPLVRWRVRTARITRLGARICQAGRQAGRPHLPPSKRAASCAISFA